VAELRSIGIQPDMIVARSDLPVNGDLRQKIATFCDVELRAVVPLVTLPTIYQAPLVLEEAGVANLIIDRLGLESRKQPDWSDWEHLVKELTHERPKVKIALVGKYVELQDAYMSVREALKHAGVALGHEVEIVWVHSAELEKTKDLHVLESVNGIVVPGGFGTRGIEGKILAARYAREHKVPYLGLCLGMQIMVVDFARCALEDESAHSTEFDQNTKHPVIDLLPEQRDIADMGGTMRLGLYPCQLQPGTKAAAAYGKQKEVQERHRHRFEFNNSYRETLAAKGMVFSGLSPDGRLVEIAELADHPFMVGSQFHPEFLSRPNRPHPLFRAFVDAAIKFGKR
jgi:CTP synthase